MLLFNLHKWSLLALGVLVSTSTIQAINEIVVNWDKNPISASIRNVETGAIEHIKVKFAQEGPYFYIVYHDIPGDSIWRVDFYSITMQERILSVRVRGDFAIRITDAKGIMLLVNLPDAEHLTVLENPFNLQQLGEFVVVNETIPKNRVTFPLPAFFV